MKTLIKWFAWLYLSMVAAIAGGPPCWDDVPPAVKYQHRHVVAGNVGLFTPWDKNETHSLHLDGLHVSAKLNDVASGEMVELSVTNCSPSTVQIVPNTYDLVVNVPSAQPPLMRIDPTKIQRTNRTTYPPLRSATLEYGRVGTYFLFFAPDTQHPQIGHDITLSVAIGQWEFDFPFRKKREHYSGTEAERCVRAPHLSLELICRSIISMRCHPHSSKKSRGGAVANPAIS